MSHVRQKYTWWVGLVVVVAELALVPPPTFAADCKGFPGDGVDGPPLVYKDNGDGTLTDRNTGLIWEKKTTTTGSVHYVGNVYTWSDASDPDGIDPDGTLFTDFLFKLNNRCAKDETVACTRNTDCIRAGVGGRCGFAGHRDWRIPNVKELQSIVDYARCVGFPCFDPVAIDPDFGPTDATTAYWSSTTFGGVSNSGLVWVVHFNDGFVGQGGMTSEFLGRAVRGCR
jgi:hypothetical protein